MTPIFPLGRNYPSVFRDITARSVYGADVIDRQLCKDAKGKFNILLY